MSKPAPLPPPTDRTELRMTMASALYARIQVAAKAEDRRVGEWVRRLIERTLAETAPRRPRSKPGPRENPMKHSKDPVFRKLAREQEKKVLDHSRRSTP